MTRASLALATDHYVSAHRAFARNGTAASPEWLRELRAEGIGLFAEGGFPSSDLEEWRFTSVEPIAATAFTLAREPRGGTRPTGGDVAGLLLAGADRPRLVFVNGRFDPTLSRADGLPDGVVACSLAGALTRAPESVREHLGASRVQSRSAFAALNTAFLRDGAFVRVRSGVVLEEPLQILHLSVPGIEPLVSHPRTLVVVDRLARVAVLEVFAAAGDGVYWTNAVTELVVGEGARADIYRVQRDSEMAYHVASTHVRQGRDSEASLHSAAFGASLARHDISAVLEGEGARCLLNGLYLGRGGQHVDHHTLIDHAQPHCESREHFNGMLDGEAHGVFNGRIVVREGAQRTDSRQTNNNLLLSERARADSQPQLEIHADDVKCTHGAAVGPLDERALFYLRSRGIGDQEARAMLTYGFGADILSRMGVPRLREQLDGMLRQRVLGRVESRPAA